MQKLPTSKKDGATAKREHVSWTIPMDTAFIEAMLKEQDKGNRPNGTFTSEAYTNMAEELSKSLNKNIKKDNLQNRLRTLKSTFAYYYDIFRGASLSGFSWDPVTKLMQAEDEVWEALIKEKPDTAKLRTKPILHYDELVELFGKDRATGEASGTAKERKKQMKQDEQPVETIDEIDQLLETNEISFENFTTDDNDHVTPQVQHTNTLPSKSKKRKLEEDAFTSKIMSSLNNLANAIDRTTKVMESSRPHVYSEVEIYKELELMGVIREDISHAYLFLVGNPEKTRALFGVPLEMRMGILATMMDGNE